MAKIISAKSAASRVYRKEEFAAFLKLLEHGQVAFWKEIAEALDVDKDTITYWKSLPEAQAARARGLDYALSQMETVGRRDWRMWHEKYKLLAGKSEQAIQINFIAAVLAKYGVNEGEGVNEVPRLEEITERSSTGPT